MDEWEFEDKFPALSKRKKVLEDQRLDEEKRWYRKIERVYSDKIEKELTANFKHREYIPKNNVKKKCQCGFFLKNCDHGQLWCSKCKDFYKGAIKC